MRGLSCGWPQPTPRYFTNIENPEHSLTHWGLFRVSTGDGDGGGDGDGDGTVDGDGDGGGDGDGDGGTM